VGRRLSWHDIKFRVLDAAVEDAAVEVFRGESVQFSPQSVEGHQTLSLDGAWTAETRDVGAGALFVPIAQPKARLVSALLEPQAPDSLAAWGMFNIAFEKKEYMEAYVAEDVAREQLAADPALADEFKRRLAEEPGFAENPAARLELFARRHASWDGRYNLYPVMRIDQAPK
jgi:hypothetical protein